ncbi:hypothetical protein TNCV_4683151 [Trichonephila clavipes]|nr:hypothetical protein TNCV_4683151 [Trichonephila clavipes]
MTPMQEQKTTSGCWVNPHCRSVRRLEESQSKSEVKNWKTVDKSRDAWRKLLEKARATQGCRAIEKEEALQLANDRFAASAISVSNHTVYRRLNEVRLYFRPNDVHPTHPRSQMSPHDILQTASSLY